MTAQQEPLFEIPPAPAPSTVGWTCGKCGNDDPRRLSIDASLPTLDPNYALGLCDCTKARTVGGRRVRERVSLIRSELFNRAAFDANETAKVEAKLMKRFKRGDLLTDDEREEVRAIVARLNG